MSTDVQVERAAIAGTPYSYDIVPYDSQPFAQSQPDQTAAMAALFGLSPVPPERARVLELGCSAGGNIIPLAVRYPGMKVVGIELSRVEVEQGQRTIAELGLTNIEIRHANILDVVEEDAQYDYIIAHGVFSWVPPQVQNAILRLVGRQLSDDGLAYISYNVYPGWKMREVIREMMLFHAGALADPKLKLQQGRAILDYARKINANDSAFGKLLAQEADLVMRANDYYLFHDHMEENNHPCYFKDFVQRAGLCGLSYLGEANLVDMAPQRFGGDVPQTLQMLSNGSILATEQYMDFFTNRMFRQTLLVKESVGERVNRALTPASVRHLHYTTGLTRQQPVEGALGTYRDNAERMLTVREPVMLAVADALAMASPFTAGVDDMVRLMRERGVGTGQTDEALAEAAGSHLLTLQLQGLVRAYVTPLRAVLPGARPQAFAMARYGARHTAPGPNGVRSLVTTFHTVAAVSDVQAALIELMDGQRSIDEIEAAMLADFANGRFQASQNGQQVTDPDRLKFIVRSFCTNAMQDFARAGLMAA